MSHDWIKSRQAELLAQAVDFSAALTLSPLIYGLTAADATALATDVTAFDAKLALATNPATRTKVTVAEKEEARARLVARLRSCGLRINVNPSVSDALKLGLGLNPRDREPTPFPPPGVAPQASVVSVSGRAVRIRLVDALSPTRRGKPFGVAGATVLSHVGEQPPANLDGWKFEGNTTRTVVDVLFPSTVPAGSTVWITARWYNPRAAAGPAANPVSATLAGSATQAA